MIDLVEVVDAAQAKPARRGSYAKATRQPNVQSKVHRIISCICDLLFADLDF
jgi:hypothetical protein